MGSNKRVELDVYVNNVRAVSIDIEYDGVTANIPVTHIQTDAELAASVGEEITISIPEWLAEDRGLI